MISTIFELSASLFDSIICAYFITKFNYAKFKNNYLLFPAIVIPFIFQVLADAYLKQFSILNTLIQFLLSLSYAILISRAHKFRAFCSVCIFKISLITLSSSAYYLFAMIFNDFDGILHGTDSVGRYLYVITHKVLLLSFTQLILRFYNRETRGTIINSILTFGFSIITVVGLSFSISITETTNSSPIRVHLFIIALIFLSLNIFLYVLLSQISRLQKRNYELKLLSEKTKFEERKYEEAINLWNTAEKIRHDVKHHMIALSGMIDEGNTTECKEYLDQYLNALQKTGKFSRSGNTVIDYLIDSKLSPLEKTQIIITGSVGNLSDIKDTDLASLIGNILDNAIEAEEKVKDKRIELMFSCQHDNRMIICKNNIEESVLATNPELNSTKSSTSRHGFGHQIVAEIAKKYNGLVHYFEEDGMFGVQILLPLPSNK